MISKTIGFRGTNHFQTHPYEQYWCLKYVEGRHFWPWTMMTNDDSAFTSIAHCLHIKNRWDHQLKMQSIFELKMKWLKSCWNHAEIEMMLKRCWNDAEMYWNLVRPRKAIDSVDLAISRFRIRATHPYGDTSWRVFHSYLVHQRTPQTLTISWYLLGRRNTASILSFQPGILLTVPAPEAPWRQHSAYWACWAYLASREPEPWPWKNYYDVPVAPFMNMWILLDKETSLTKCSWILDMNQPKTGEKWQSLRLENSVSFLLSGKISGIPGGWQ